MTGMPMVMLRLHGCAVGCPWCFDGETKVLMGDWSTKPIRDVRQGDLVVSYTGKTRSYKVSKVVDVTSHEAETISVQTENEDELICTPDHIFHTNHHKSRGIQKAEARNLEGLFIKRSKSGDWWDTPEITDDYLKGYLMGAYAGDGGSSYYQGYHKLHWTVCNKEFADRIAKYLNYFGRNVTLSKRKTKADRKVYRTGSILTNVEFILDYPETDEQRRGYIAGFFDAEGTGTKNDLVIAQLDPKLLHRVKSMLKVFDFDTTLDTHAPDKRNGNIMHGLRVLGGRSEVSRFFVIMNPAISRKNKTRPSKAQLTATEVCSVKPAGTRQVYNIMTSQGNFFAGGYLVDQCDTKETWHVVPEDEVDILEDALGPTPNFARVDQDEITRYIKHRWPHQRWILLSGGEPADQPLIPLVNALKMGGLKVALETSGTAPGFIGAGCDWVVVSPKINIPGGKEVRDDALTAADEIKMVIGKQADLEVFDDLVVKYNLHHKIICLQPVSQSQKATDLCMEVVKERGWRLSIQLHKYLTRSRRQSSKANIGL